MDPKMSGPVLLPSSTTITGQDEDIPSLLAHIKVAKQWEVGGVIAKLKSHQEVPLIPKVLPYQIILRVGATSIGVEEV